MAYGWIANDFGGLDVIDRADFDVASPQRGEVTIEVRAAGMNPADFKHITPGRNSDPSKLPIRIGYEVAGVITAIGPDTEIASGAVTVGEEVLAFRVRGGYATELTVPAADVFTKPPMLGFPEAANLLLAGTTAAEMLDVTSVQEGETILFHALSGAVGISALQQARLLGVRVIGTASESRFDVIRHFGGEPVAYGPGLEDRLHALAPEGIAAALDAIGTDEAIDASLALVADRSRFVTIAAPARAKAEGFRAIGGSMPASATFRDAARARLIGLAAEGKLVVPMARTFPLSQAIEALEFLSSGHPGGKIALLP